VRHSRSRPATTGRDRGAVDESLQMLFGGIALLMAFLLVFEVVAYWHVRNIVDEAAAEGARIAAAYDGTCAQAERATRNMVERSVSGWSSRLRVTCSQGAEVQVRVVVRTPGPLGDRLGVRVEVVERAPKER